jgi:hypothetical protein
MSKFTDYIDGLADTSATPARDELKELVSSSKKDESEFVRLQAVNIERWTVMLGAGEITPTGFKNLVSQMDVLNKKDIMKLEGTAKAGAQRLAEGIQKHIIEELFKLL